ncbi:protein RNA-directed DNA methylation 3 isoform X2 [Brachypodium distachyon]|uniref:KOW domain-containing protein n=1 Tax=Brachypodium distachyon TaxID=15368 RepID=A0A0Q3G2G5_BRADI|nr:protein RNA-directed DNA methylation 3 isoform X2 [Brachypodium distachyon]KQK05519.1 hypothetical protein BRADI_2g20517v3 [Brachypodium distachyon]|eukprot:XP_014754606.1 protein RNA-directed DNA methylation 3 isoform X2 [Brachypodium distachyon]
MAVKGKGKQVASDTPGSSGAKRRSGTGGAGPSSSSAAAAKRRRRPGVLQFFDDQAGVDDDCEDEEEEEEEEFDSEPEDGPDHGFFREKKTASANMMRTERSHPLPFLAQVKEEELSGDELEQFVKDRYSNRVKHSGYGGSTQEYDDDCTMDDALKEPTIWRVKCMVGRERQMAFCFMQKFIDLKKFGTKVPIISAFSLDHMRGYVFVEAEKACDVTEACKGFCNVYVSRTSPVPAAEVPSLLSTRAKPFEVSPGTWVRMKSGNYKGDLAQVVNAVDGRKRVLVKLIPRVDLLAISKKFGGAVSLKDAAVPAPRLISSQELEFFGPHIERRADRQTGDVFEVLDGLMFKDGFLYKRVALSSLIYWGIQPTDTELLKFSSSPSIKSSADDMDWLSSMYGQKKRNVPREHDMNASSSKDKCSKASNLKGSTSTESYDDDVNDAFNLHDLVLFGRKDFGVIIAVEKDGFKILKGGPEGSAVTVRKQDIKKGCVDKMFTAVDHQKKIISINDTVKVLEGPAQGKQGVVKHLYMGILFIHNDSESENNGFFCAQCGSCENIKKRRELASSEDNPISMFSDSPFMPSEQTEQRNNDRPYRAREQLFSIGEMLRIRKGPMKGYLCRVVRIFRNDVTVKLDSLLKIVTVQAEFLSVPTKRGDNSSSAAAGPFGTQDTSFFGSEAEKTSWNNGLTSLGSDSWQPPSSSAFPFQNADGGAEADPWCKKTSSSADGDCDPWCKKTTSADVGIWNNSTTQKDSSSDNSWDKQAGGGGLDVGGSSWAGAAVNKQSEKSDNWGEACKAVDMATGGNTDPWGSKVKVVTEEADGWGKSSLPPEKKLEDDGQGWGRSFGTSNKEQEKEAVSKVADNSRSWDTAIAICDGSGDDAWGKSKENNGDGAVGWNKAITSNQNSGSGGWDTAAANWSKPSPVGQGHEEAWGKEKDSAAKSEEINDGGGSWKKAGSSDQVGAGDWDKPKFSGNAGPSSWNKGEAVGGDNQNSNWSKPGGNFEGGRGFGRGRGRGWGQESGDLGGRNDQGNLNSSWGNDSSARPSWRSDTQVSNEGGDSGGGGYRGRGRGRGQYGGRGRGRDNVWGNGDRGSSEFGREGSSGDTLNWENSQPCRGSEGTKPCDENQTSTWNSSDDKKASGGEPNDPWASKMTTKGQEQQCDAWSSKMTSTAGAENNNDSWNTKAKEPSCSDGTNWENAVSGEERQGDPWASKTDCSTKGKEQETDPWASKVASTAGADNNKNGWNTKEKGNSTSSGAGEKEDTWNIKGGNGNGGGWNNTGSSAAWSKPSSTSGDQEPAWSKPTYGDDDTGYGRGGFGRGNRGRGRGRFGDGGSSWNGGSNLNDESGGERSEDRWNRRDSDGGRGRGRGRFGRGDRHQDNFGSGDGDGGSWSSGRGNRGRGGGYRNWNDNNEGRSFSQGRGGGWSQSSDWNAGKKESTEGDQDFSKGKSSWGGDKNDSWGGPKQSGGDDQAGKSDGSNAWNQNKPSLGDGSSVLGQWGGPSGDTTTSRGGSVGGGGSCGNSENQAFSKGKSNWGSDKNDCWGAPKPHGGDDQAGKNDGNNSWNQTKPSLGDGPSILGQWGGGAPVGSGVKSNEDGWNSSKGTEGGTKKEGSWGKPGGSGSGCGSQGGGGSSWDKGNAGGWNSNKGGDTSKGGGW